MDTVPVHTRADQLRHVRKVLKAELATLTTLIKQGRVPPTFGGEALDLLMADRLETRVHYSKGRLAPRSLAAQEYLHGVRGNNLLRPAPTWKRGWLS
jgi:hypothetical protein